MSSRETNATTKIEPEQLELRYLPLSEVRRWDENPKRHDIDRLIRSIELHGFGDPPKFDTSLCSLVYGNGRTEALEQMRKADKQPPRGITILDSGEWGIPIIFGVDSEDKAKAKSFAIDHNNLSLLGGGLGFEDILQIWDEGELASVLSNIPDTVEFASFSRGDIDAILIGPEFKPVAAEEQSRLDEKKHVTCPECGHEFRP